MVINRLSYIIATFCIAFTFPAQAKTMATAEKHPAREIQGLHAGDYLASRFAQQRHDWTRANNYLNKLVDDGITPDDIMQRAMILAMGSGDAEQAVSLAKQIKAENPQTPNTVAEIFLIAEAFKHDDYSAATKLFENLPQDGTIEFIGPFVKGWLRAAQNALEIKELKDNTLELYHAILISDFLKDHSEIERMIDKALQVEDINPYEQEKIADLYGHAGLRDKAIELYERILKEDPENQGVALKLSTIQDKRNKPLFEKIGSAREGMAKALHDISSTLFSENNDETARVFGHLALYLEPDMVETRLLLATINANHKQYEKSIELYKSVPKTNDNYLNAQFEIVDVYEEMNRFEDAIALLEELYKIHKDVDIIIKIGNLHRHRKEFKQALKSYDEAIEKLGGDISADYWHLHYVRGISYEQSGQWEKAEKELKAALVHQPDHPYVLNYLGYAWADRGEHLEQSLEMIRRAVELRPSDGYITDSLGWVYYRVKDYENAVTYLERAVELLPNDPTINDHLGDAYWKVGRNLEAKFQWRRAKNHSEDQEQIEQIDQKLSSGLKDI